MNQHTVSIVRYKDGDDRVRKAIELSGAFSGIRPGNRVFIKPNIVIWTDKAVFPKWGVITTSRVMEDVVATLSDLGVTDITIGEGIVTIDPKNRTAAAHAFHSLGYDELSKRYGVKTVNVMDRPFERVDLGVDADIRLNADALHSDFIVNIPVLKTHAQAVVSLGMKNLKGLLNIASRKKFHSPDPDMPLDFLISKLYMALPKSATVIDGIYTLERGPAPDGRARRSNIIIASGDILSADMVGAKVLGHDPSSVPSISFAAKSCGRKTDLSDIEVRGEEIASVASYHEWDFPYNDSGTLPIKMDRMGVTGLSYRKYDSTLCTYCSVITGAMLTSINFAWKGAAWDGIEILTGKSMRPSKGMKKTILLGQCMYLLNKDHPDINEMIAVKRCPPDPMETAKALRSAGIPVEYGIFQNIEGAMGFFMLKYKDRPEFEERFYTVC